jgi:hypothetical protein
LWIVVLGSSPQLDRAYFVFERKIRVAIFQDFALPGLRVLAPGAREGYRHGFNSVLVFGDEAFMR